MGGGKADTIDPVGAVVGRDNGAFNALNPASLAVTPDPPETARAERAKRVPVKTKGINLGTPGDEDTSLLGI
jgi:hypothetical protein